MMKIGINTRISRQGQETDVEIPIPIPDVSADTTGVEQGVTNREKLVRFARSCWEKEKELGNYKVQCHHT